MGRKRNTHKSLEERLEYAEQMNDQLWKRLKQLSNILKRFGYDEDLLFDLKREI
jgi:hypothetical protein